MTAVEWLGIAAITIMVTAYAMEKRHPNWVAIFSVGCALAAVYALLITSYPFLVAESVWAFIAGMRWFKTRRSETNYNPN